MQQPLISARLTRCRARRTSPTRLVLPVGPFRLLQRVDARCPQLKRLAIEPRLRISGRGDRRHQLRRNVQLFRVVRTGVTLKVGKLSRACMMAATDVGPVKPPDAFHFPDVPAFSDAGDEQAYTCWRVAGSGTRRVDAHEAGNFREWLRPLCGFACVLGVEIAKERCNQGLSARFRRRRNVEKSVARWRRKVFPRRDLTIWVCSENDEISIT